MKKTAILLVLLILSSTLSAQRINLREVVAVVKPIFGEANVTFLNSFADNLKKMGYDSTAVFISDYAKGQSFGSGFAYTDSVSNRVYIVTNRHVVVQAQTVNIEFLLADMSVKSFNQCQIVAADDVNDLALIALPEGASLSKTLSFANQLPFDGDEVFTAGYPELSNKPSWQVGNGIISNSNIHVDEWIPNKDGFIQHTAEIDAGSSGGPLLIKSPTNNQNYEVIGLNTWKAVDRQNANFAIKSSTIMKFIQGYLQSKQKTGKQLLEDRANQFMSISKDGHRAILPYISYDYISKLSVDGFFQTFDASSKEIKDKVKNQFEEMLPIEGVRIIIANTISNKLNIQGFTFAGIENYSEKGPVTVLYKKGEETISTSWVIDQGNWCLSDISTVHFKNSSTMHSNKRFEYLYYGLNRELYFNHLSNSNGLNLYYGYMNSSSRYSISLAFAKVFDTQQKSTYDDDAHDWLDVDYVQSHSFGGVQFSAGLQRVFTVNKFSFIPYIDGVANLYIEPSFDTEKYNGFYGGARLGVDATYQYSKSGDDCIGLGLSYIVRKCFLSFNDYNGILSGLSLNVIYYY